MIALVLSSAGCEPGPPEKVFVQGERFSHVVRVTSDQGDRASVVVGVVASVHRNDVDRFRAVFLLALQERTRRELERSRVPSGTERGA